MSTNKHKSDLLNLRGKVITEIEPIVKQSINELSEITKNFLSDVFDELFKKQPKKRKDRK